MTSALLSIPPKSDFNIRRDMFTGGYAISNQYLLRIGETLSNYSDIWMRKPPKEMVLARTIYCSDVNNQVQMELSHKVLSRIKRI